MQCDFSFSFLMNSYFWIIFSDQSHSLYIKAARNPQKTGFSLSWLIGNLSTSIHLFRILTWRCQHDEWLECTQSLSILVYTHASNLQTKTSAFYTKGFLATGHPEMNFSFNFGWISSQKRSHFVFNHQGWIGMDKWQI